VRGTTHDVVAIGLAALLGSGGAYLLFRWRQNLAVAAYRSNRQLQERLPRLLRPLFSVGSSYGAQRRLHAISTVMFAGMAVVCWVMFVVGLVRAARGEDIHLAPGPEFPAPTPAEMPPPVHLLFTLLGAGLFAWGAYRLTRLADAARHVQWLYDTSIPLDQPYGRADAPGAPAPRAWSMVMVIVEVLVSCAMGVALLSSQALFTRGSGGP